LDIFERPPGVLTHSGRFRGKEAIILAMAGLGWMSSKNAYQMNIRDIHKGDLHPPVWQADIGSMQYQQAGACQQQRA
jgi:hypothetical protein